MTALASSSSSLHRPRALGWLTKATTNARLLVFPALLIFLMAAAAACSSEEVGTGSPTESIAQQPMVDVLAPTSLPTVTPARPDPTSTPRPAPTPTPELKTLTLLYWQAPSLPFPYLAAGFKDRDAAAVTLESLAVYDPDGNLVPKLAQEIPTIENGGISEDGLTITWQLREGLKWSDGSDLTADDIVFTWRYCTAEGSGCLAEHAFAAFESVEAVGPFEVALTLGEPENDPEHLLAGSSAPIINATQFADCLGPAALTCDANTTPLGSGPYRIVEFVPNERAVYERNPHYRGESPYFDRVVIEGGGDAESAARAVLVDGTADYAWNLQIDPSQLNEMEAAGLGEVIAAFASDVERLVINQTNAHPDLGDDRSEYLGGNNPHPFLTFAPIRQAMSMSIDRQRIVDDFYGDEGTATCNLVVAPEAFVSDSTDFCLAQNIEGAKSLLDANGVVDTDGDGVREYNGEPLLISFQTTANAVREGTFSFIQDWWSEIGIESTLVTHDASIFFGGDPAEHPDASYRRFFADVQMYTTGPDLDPEEYLSTYQCDRIQSRDNGWAEDNNARMCDADYDTLYATLEDAETDEERETTLKSLNDIIVQQAYEIPLVSRGFVSAKANSLQGVRINAWDTELWNIGEWYREG